MACISHRFLCHFMAVFIRFALRAISMGVLYLLAARPVFSPQSSIEFGTHLSPSTSIATVFCGNLWFNRTCSEVAFALFVASLAAASRCSVRVTSVVSIVMLKRSSRNGSTMAKEGRERA